MLFSCCQFGVKLAGNTYVGSNEILIFKNLFDLRETKTSIKNFPFFYIAWSWEYSHSVLVLLFYVPVNTINTNLFVFLGEFCRGIREEIPSSINPRRELWNQLKNEGYRYDHQVTTSVFLPCLFVANRVISLCFLGVGLSGCLVL